MVVTSSSKLVDALVAPLEMDCVRSRAHLFGVLPPDVRQWDVDLAVPRFTAGPTDQPYVTSTVQLVGTWSARDNSWLWADHNTSVSVRGYEALIAILDGLDELRELRARSRFELDKETALSLATFCARKANFAAAWPGVVGESIAMLAVDPIIWPASKGETRNRQWCTFCGKTRTEVKTLISGPGVMVCNECVALLADLRRSSDTVDVPTLPPCVFCAERTPRVFTPYAAMCFACIDLAANALNASGPTRRA